MNFSQALFIVSKLFYAPFVDRSLAPFLIDDSNRSFFYFVKLERGSPPSSDVNSVCCSSRIVAKEACFFIVSDPGLVRSRTIESVSIFLVRLVVYSPASDWRGKIILGRCSRA